MSKYIKLEDNALADMTEFLKRHFSVSEKDKLSCVECRSLAEKILSRLSTTDMVGEWRKEYNGNGWNDYWDYTCPNCGKKYERADSVLYDSSFCPNCGAKMTGASSVVPRAITTVDTLLIAAALRDLAQDSERNMYDRKRAEELRKQVLAYGASMCQSVSEPRGDDIIVRSNVYPFRVVEPDGERG